MPSNYTGNSQAVQTPAPAPGPGVKLIIARPIDSEGGAASLYQGFDSTADYITYLLASDYPWLPYTPIASGFTAVTYNAFGGTVAPSGAGANLGKYYVIKIIVGGAVGTATFQSSMDGGNTFGATQTTAASMTDVTTGVTLAFAGTLTINGTAAFQAALTPQALYKDSGGNIRHLIDHNGYPAARRSEFRENWLATVSGYSTAGNNNIPGLPAWCLNVAAAPLGITTDISFSNFGSISLPAASLYVDPNTSNGGKVEMATGHALSLQTFMSLVMEWEGGIGTVGANNQTAVMGLFGSTAITTVTTYLAFRKASGNTNWQAATNNGGAGTPVDTGVAPVANALQRFRIEYHGSATPIGMAFGAAVALFFINELLVASITGTLPVAGGNQNLNFGFGILNTAGLGALQPMVISPVYATWNRALSLAAL